MPQSSWIKVALTAVSGEGFGEKWWRRQVGLQALECCLTLIVPVEDNTILLDGKEERLVLQLIYRGSD